MKRLLLTVITAIAMLPVLGQQVFVVDPLVIEEEVIQSHMAEVYTMVYNYGPDTLEVIFPAWVERGFGGPDDYGYYWIDSDEEGGPGYEWIEISETGTEIVDLGDDTFAGPFPMGFDFPFYGQNKEIFFVQSNGAITFDDVLISFANDSIPTGSEQTDFIAWFWDDLTIDTAFTHCYYKNFDNKVVIQFEKFVQYPGTEQWITAEVIIQRGGDIRIMYKQVREGFESENGTIGIQSYNPDMGLLVAYNEPYVHSEMCLRFDSPAGFIVDVSPSDFLLPPGTQEHVWITWDSEGFELGTYHQDLKCITNDTTIAPIFIDNVMHVINPNTAGFHGYVTDAASGLPIVECKVKVGEHQVFTNEAGYYEIGLEPGVYNVRFSRNGYQTLEVDDTTALEPFSILDVELEGFYFIAGRVWAGDDFVPQALSNLYELDENGTVIHYYADMTGEEGWFEYPELPSGDYIVKAEPNPGSSYYGTYLPTYYGDVLHWEDASVISLIQSTDDAHIHLVAATMMPQGDGSISGTLETGGDQPLEGYNQVFLQLSGSGDATMVYTDMNGNFEFSDLGYGTYELFAEIPGKSITPMSITLDENTPSVTGITMVVSGDQIIFLGIEESEYFDGISQTYPNPAGEQVNLMVDLKRPTNLRVEVIDIAGRIILSDDMSLQSSGMIKVNTSPLPAGYYYLRLSDHDGQSVTRSFIKN